MVHRPLLLFLTFVTSLVYGQSPLQEKIDPIIRPLMEEYGIPGMIVGITVDGKHQFYTYGVASKETGQPVSPKTLFEVGSISKTFTATLAAFAETTNHLRLTDPVSKYLPALKGTAFDQISLLQAGTHTTGGLPLQVPDEVRDETQLTEYLRNWKPAHTPGTFRSYSNPGTGVFGRAAAAALKLPFDDAMEKKLLPQLGMRHTYVRVPETEMEKYAQGYNSKNEPVRVNPGPFASEAYGIKTDAEDLLRYVDIQLFVTPVNAKLTRAITNTHVGYVSLGGMTQDLMWEQYAWPADLPTLLAGNSPTVALEQHPVTQQNPPIAPGPNVWINKTGSTNGFGGYVVFIPALKTGVVILANKSYPNQARVAAAHAIFAQLNR